jgi:DNA-binding CsgD family transcriptional regulator
MGYLDPNDDAPHLSIRERQVLERVAHGRSAKEVASDLGITHRTVERHIENARYKMRARNKTHTIAKAVFCGELVLALGSQDNEEPDPARENFIFRNQQI